MKPILSIIYIYFNTPIEISISIKSIDGAVENLSYEIIIVDNASDKIIPLKIKNDSLIKFIKNKNNLGFGTSVNIAAKIARGEYLLIVNPDTEFKEESIKEMIKRIKEDKKIGVIGPQLLSEKGKILQSINSMPFLPRALFSFSFLNKLWKNNPFSRSYWLYDLDRNKEHEVDFVGGACLLIRRNVFNMVKGFDENFFLYFEEADICFRIKKLGYKILYFPKSKIIHLVGRSEQNKKKIEQIFEKSRFYFFRKYHNFIFALLGEGFLRFEKKIKIFKNSIS